MRQSVNAVISTRKDIKDFLMSSDEIMGLFDLNTTIEKSRVNLYRECYDNIGNTSYHTILLSNKNKLHVKLEYNNAMGANHYSRYWIPYLFIAETLGIIKPEEDEILEVTSGSSGIALANACEKLGYRLTIVVPEMISKARYEALKKPNVKVIQVKGYIDACINKMKEIRNSDKHRYFMANHAEEKANIITYVFSRIGYEFITQKGIPDYAILALGNGTSAEAVATTFTKNMMNKRCWFVAYHPDIENTCTKPVLGLLPPRVQFRHVESIKKMLDDIELTNHYDISATRNRFTYDDEVQTFGLTSLYGLAIAEKLAKTVENQSFFCIGYDKYDMY